MEDIAEDTLKTNDKLSPTARYDDQGLIFALIFGAACTGVMLLITLFLHYTPILWIKRLYRPNHTREPEEEEEEEEEEGENKDKAISTHNQEQQEEEEEEEQEEQQSTSNRNRRQNSNINETLRQKTFSLHKRRGISLPFRSTFFILPSLADWRRVEEQSIPHLKLNTELDSNSNENTNSESCHENSNSSSSNSKSNTVAVPAAMVREVQGEELTNTFTQSPELEVNTTNTNYHTNNTNREHSNSKLSVEPSSISSINITSNDRYKTPLDPQAAVYLFSLKYFTFVCLAGLIFTIWITVIAHGDDYIDYYLLRRDPNKCHEQDDNETACTNLAPRCVYLGQDIGCSPVALRGVYDMTVQNIHPKSWRWWPVAILNVMFAISFILITVWCVKKLNAYIQLITQEQLRNALGYRVACVRGVDPSLLTSPTRFREVFLSERAYFPSSTSEQQETNATNSNNTTTHSNNFTNTNNVPIVATHGHPVSLRRATINRIIRKLSNNNNKNNKERIGELQAEEQQQEEQRMTNDYMDDSEDVYEQIDCAGVGCLFSVVGCHYTFTRRSDATFTQHPDKVKHILFTKTEPRHMYKYIHDAEHAMERLQEVIAVDKILQRRIQRKLARIAAIAAATITTTHTTPMPNKHNNNYEELRAKEHRQEEEEKEKSQMKLQRRLSEPTLLPQEILEMNEQIRRNGITGNDSEDEVRKFKEEEEQESLPQQKQQEQQQQKYKPSEYTSSLHVNYTLPDENNNNNSYWKTRTTTQSSIDSNSALLHSVHQPLGNETIPSYAATSDIQTNLYSPKGLQGQLQQNEHNNNNNNNSNSNNKNNSNNVVLINEPHVAIMMYARLPWWCSLIRNNSIINNLSGHSKNLLGNHGIGYYCCCSCCCFCKCCPWYHPRHRLFLNNDDNNNVNGENSLVIIDDINPTTQQQQAIAEEEEEEIKEIISLESERPHGFGLCKRIPALPYYETKFRNVATKLNTCIDQVPHERSSGPVFVVFSDSRAAFEFIGLFTARFGGFFSNLSSRIAGPPGRLITANLHINHFLDIPRFIVLSVVFIVLLFFWSVPVGILGSLDNIALIPGIGPQMSVYYHEHIPQWLRNIATAYLPVIVLALFNTVLPLIIRFIVLTMGAFNKNERDGGHLYLQYLFMVLTTVIFQAALQGGLTQLANLVLSPDGDAITNFFVACVTPNGGYWYAKVITAATLANWLEVIDPIPLVKAALLRHAVSMQRSYDALFEPPTPEWPQRYSVDLVLLAIGMLFHMMVPLLNGFVLLYFVVRYYTQRGRLSDRHSLEGNPCSDCTDFGLIAQVIRSTTWLFCLAEMGGVLLMSLRRHTGGVVLNSCTLAMGFGLMLYVHLVSAQWVVSLSRVRELMPTENGVEVHSRHAAETEEEQQQQQEQEEEEEEVRYLQREEAEDATVNFSNTMNNTNSHMNPNDETHMTYSPLTSNLNRNMNAHRRGNNNNNNNNTNNNNNNNNNTREQNNSYIYSSYGTHRANDETLADGYPNLGLDVFGGDPPRNPFIGHLLPRKHEPHSRYQPKHQRLAHIDIDGEINRMHNMEFVVHRY